MKDLGFRIYGLGFGVQGLGLWLLVGPCLSTILADAWQPQLGFFGCRVGSLRMTSGFHDDSYNRLWDFMCLVMAWLSRGLKGILITHEKRMKTPGGCFIISPDNPDFHGVPAQGLGVGAWGSDKQTN